MTAGRSERRPVKIRRRGRHATPSQAERVAAQAGKAAPAVAIAGVLVTLPQALTVPAQAATAATAATQARQASQPRVQAPQPAHPAADASTPATEAVSAHVITVASTVRARHAAPASSTYYTVRGGDTLSAIAERSYHKASDWQYLYHENDKTVANPNLIYAGQKLLIPATAPAHYTLANYVPRHARPAVTPDQDSDDSDTSASTTTTPPAASGGGGGGGGVTLQSASQGGAGPAGGLSGTLSCSGLERLWNAAGGNPADAFIAAEIAMAESGGNQYALSPTGDYGYWQINASNGSLATFDAYGNARSAVILSHDGTDWYPWTTYTSGAYAGRC